MSAHAETMLKKYIVTVNSLHNQKFILSLEVRR